MRVFVIIFTMQVLYPQDYMVHPKLIRLRKSLIYHLFGLLYRQLIVITIILQVRCELLTPFIPLAYCTKELFTFIKDIQEVSTQDSFMISYDVCSLFTNIPQSETIDIAVKLILEKTLSFR